MLQKVRFTWWKMIVKKSDRDINILQQVDFLYFGAGRFAIWAGIDMERQEDR